MTARVAETDLLREAVEVADRLLANIETVVHGKRDEIRLVLTALACNGHVLFEDVPGTAKTVLARAIAQSIEGAIGTRIQCTPDLQPTDVTGLAVYDQRIREFEFRPGPDLRQRRARRRDQPRDAEDPVGAARGDGRAAGDGRRHHARRPTPVPAARDREPDRVRGNVPAARRPSSTASSCGPRSAIPAREEELQVIGDQRIEHPLASLRPIVGVARSRRSSERSRDVYIDPLIAAWIVELVRATREMSATSPSARPCAAAWRSSAPCAAGRSCTAATTSCPTDVERLFVAVLGHRVVFTPTKLARGAPDAAWPRVVDCFADECLSLAAPPLARASHEPSADAGSRRMIGSRRRSRSCRGGG